MAILINFTRASGAIAAAILSLSMPNTSIAQSLQAGCFTTPAKLADQDIHDFLSDPKATLAGFPQGGLVMSSRIRSLVGSSASSIDPIFAVVKDATSLQVSAIGSGLARAARACVSSNPDYAALIQEKVASANNPDLTNAFLQANEQLRTAALGGGGDGGGATAASGLTGGGATIGATGGQSGDNFVATESNAFSIATSGRFSSFTQVVNQSVSP